MQDSFGLCFDELSRANLERCNKMFHPIEDWSIGDWAVAVAGEVGEACNLIKKMRRGDNINVHDIIEEIADVVIYADLLTTRLGYNLGDEVFKKFNKVSEQKKCNIRL